MKCNVWLFRGTESFFMEMGRAVSEIINYEMDVLCSLTSDYNPDVTWNILFGGNQYAHSHPDVLLPNNVILVNMEQLSHHNPWCSPSYLNLLRNATHVWDYNTLNRRWIECNLRIPSVQMIHIGYHPSLLIFNQYERKDIDVLFFGGLSQRRLDIIEKIRSTGLNVVARHNLWGLERADMIARSKIILNIHYEEDTTIFESVRVLPLITSRCCVVSETSVDDQDYSDMHDMYIRAPPDQLHHIIQRYVENPSLLEQIRENIRSHIKNVPFRIPILTP